MSVDLMNFIVNHRAFNHNTKLFIAKKLSRAAAEDFNVRAQNHRCTISLFIFEFNEFCYYVPYVYFIFEHRDSLNFKRRKTVILRVAG